MRRDYPRKVKLKDDRMVAIRPLAREDFDKLFAFFQAMPENDRTFLRHDVRNPDLIQKWTENIDFDHVIPLVAEDGDEIVAEGTLHMATHGWMHHVGLIRLVTAKTHRRNRLGTFIVKELVAIAQELNLEMLQTLVIEDEPGSVEMFQKLGFKKAAVLRNIVKDQNGYKRNLAIMLNEVDSIDHIIEDWIFSSMSTPLRGSVEGSY
ncbi:GNAT family N-acetyltransferase [Nitrospinota bacterium]